MTDMFEADDPTPLGAPSLDSIDQLERDSKNNKRRAALVLFAVIPTLTAVVGGAWWYFGEQAADEAIATAWNDASACLVGTPLAQGDKASLRMRAIQLAAVHSERDRKTDTRWPGRCGDQLATLFEALRKHGRDSGGTQGLAARAEQLAVQLRKTDVMNDVSGEVDGLFDAAAAEGLSAEPASLQIPTPEPAQGFNLDTLPASARISGLQYTLDNVSSTPMVGTEIHALVYDRKVDPKPILCTFGASGADRCRDLGGELVDKSGLRLSATVDDGASPLVLAGRAGEDGVYRSDGAFAKITTMAVQSAYVAKDGYVALAGFAQDAKTGQFDLVQQAGDGAPITTTPLTPEMFGSDTYQVHRVQLLWGKLMAQVLDGNKDDVHARLVYVDLPLHDKSVKGKVHDIGEINWLNAGIFGCRTHETTVVGVGISQGFLTFLEGDRWSKPVALDAVPRAIGCTAGEAVFTGAMGDQQRCTPAGCQFVDGVVPSYEPFSVKQSYWADLEGKILSVASTGRRGGLRYRLATGKNLGAPGADQLLFDDLIRDGEVQKDSSVLGMLLAGRGRYAVTLLTTPKGVYALRFDASGKPKPANIRR